MAQRRLHAVDHRAGAQEQQRLEEGVRQQVEDAGDPAADAQRRDHKAQLRERRVGQDALDIELADRDQRRAERRDRADRRDHRQRAAGHEDRVGAPDQEHARRDHRGRVDQRRDGRRPLHRVGQPDMQRELRRLADRAGEQQECDTGCYADAERGRRLGDPPQELRVEYLPWAGAEIQRAGLRPQKGQADHKQHIADARRDEGLDRRLAWGDLARVGVDFIVPEADQEIRAQAHQLPGHKEQQQVAGHHHQEHRGREQRDK